MRKALVVLLICLISSVASASQVRRIVLTEHNVIPITSIFVDEMAAEFNAKILKTRAKHLYVFIDSPGGSVGALTDMIEVIKGTKVKLTCITRFGASAAFMLSQYCDERYMVSSGVLMSHNAAGWFAGELPRVRSRLDAVTGLVEDLERTIAKRLGMSFEEYKRDINNNMWMNSTQALAKNAVDGIAVVTCNRRTVNKKVRRTATDRSFFGYSVTEKTFSACPLITSPIEEKGEEGKVIRYITNAKFLRDVILEYR